MPAAHARVFPLPLVGRQGELASLREALTEAAAKRGRTVLLCGEGGIGKSRLAQAALDEASARGWTTVVGRAYAVETGVPYALFADALVPLLRGLDAGARQVLTRGGDAELARLFPALHPSGTAPAPADGDGAELKARLLWACAQLLTRLASRQPVLLVLENLHWADASSLELLHFIARHAAGERLLLLCTYIDAAAEHDAPLRATERSLASLGAAVVRRLAPLSRDDTAALLQAAFGADPEVVRDFTTLLYGWTRGNPFFIEEILKALVESGRLYEREGRWLGWELDALELPRSVRDAVLARLDRLPPAAREVANVAAVLGTHTGYDVLRAVSALSDADLLSALDELRRQQVLVERDDAHEAVYDFAHPMLQEVLYAELGKARARRLHALVADALESHFGTQAQEHAGELAFHFARAEPRVAGSKAVRYLAAAGQAALAKYANREAAGYLQAALDQVERLPEPTGLPSVASLSDDLARARQRLGETDPARLLLERARARAERDGDLPHVAALARRLGLLEFWCGNFADALRHYETGVAAAQAAGARDTLARLRLTQGSLLLALGHRDEARLRVEEALHIAEAAGDAALLARVHRALLLLHAWTGPPEQGREHGRRAAALAAASGQRAVEWSVHWGLAMLEGLTGNAHAAAHHLAESERIADELRSPLLRLWSAEVTIEYRSGVGDFAASLAVAEPAIASARAFGLRTLLPRLLVWTGNVYLQRGDEQRGRALLTEAWELSRAGDARRQPLDVHTVVPAYTGMVLLYNLTHEHARAREMGEAGLAVADRTGFVAWSVYRLLPALIEATLYLGDLDASVTYAARLRRDSSALGHPLGLAWANAADALIEFRRGREAEAAPRLQAAVAQLEAVPYPYDAARLRRMAAHALVSAGDVDGAARELRQAHEVFARLGAERELAGTRERLRELGVRPPARATSTGVAGLTGRELDIARLVAERRSNKEIGATLCISPRTVSTHLSNIFAKLDVGSRGELVDRLRAERVLEG